MIEELLSMNIPHEIIVLIISALPVVELRGALPVAINIFHIPWYKALCLSVVGNLMPVPVLLLAWEFIYKVMCKTSVGEKLANWVLKRTRQRSEIIVKYGKIGLVMFVAVPLPVTGAWTGSIAAFILGIKFKDAFLSIMTGVIIAGGIVSCLCLLGWVVVIAGGAVSFIVVMWYRKRKGVEIERSDGRDR